MTSLRRIFVSFAILFDIVGFALVFIIMSNAVDEENLIYMAESDAVFASVISLVGTVINVLLALIVARSGLEARRRQAGRMPESRGRITGE